MPTSVNVTNLKINELTEAQYDSAVQGGVIGANELSILTDAEVGQVIQVATLPTASADELDNVYQFVGTTDANYTNGYFYKCVSDGQQPATYSWSNIQVQASSGGLPSQTGQSGKFLTTDGTDASWSDKPLVNVATGTDSIAIGGTSSNVRSVAIGVGSSTSANNSTAIGKGASSGNAGVSIGYFANSRGLSSIAIGAAAAATANGSIQINAYSTGRTNSDANTFKVGNNNGNFEMMSADGTIPAARHASLPATDGTYVLKLVITSGVPTLSWVAE